MVNQTDKKRILVVDDEAKNLAVAKSAYDILKKYGYSTQVTQSADEALRIIGRGGCDIVVSDLMFPSTEPETITKYRKLSKRVRQFWSNPENHDVVREKDYSFNGLVEVSVLKNQEWPMGYRECIETPYGVLKERVEQEIDIAFGEKRNIPPEVRDYFAYFGFGQQKIYPLGNVIFLEARKKGLDAFLNSSIHRHRLEDDDELWTQAEDDEKDYRGVKLHKSYLATKMTNLDVRTLILPLLLEFPELVKPQKNMFYFDETYIHSNAEKDKPRGWFYGGGYNSQYFHFIPEDVRKELNERRLK